jgi:hypothetical protein
MQRERLQGLPDETPVTVPLLRYSITLAERECSERDLLLRTQR